MLKHKSDGTVGKPSCIAEVALQPLATSYAKLGELLPQVRCVISAASGHKLGVNCRKLGITAASDCKLMLS